MDDDEREMALELPVGGARGLEQVALVLGLDQVDDDLGVGLRAEGVAVGLERRLQLAVVLDDPVQDDREPALVAAGQRVRVLLGDLTGEGMVRVLPTQNEPATDQRLLRMVLDGLESL